MAERYHWTPEQVGELDPEYVEELRAFWAGQGDHQKLQHKREERQQRRGRG